MTHTSETGWMPDSDNRRHDMPPSPNADFDHTQQGKPIKAVIGVAVLVVLALILARMNPVPHEITADPSATPIGQATSEHVR